MKEKTSSYQNDKLEFVKNPVMIEFLGLTPDISFTETKIKTSIITNLQKFLMQMGKGYAFVARQQYIHTEKQDYGNSGLCKKFGSWVPWNFDKPKL